MSKLDDLIEIARKHVAEGRRIVAVQRQRIASGKLRGQDAHDLLTTFERSLEIFEHDLDRLLKTRDEK